MPSDYHRIESAIAWISENQPRQPSLHELARHLGLSSFHTQRLFRRWAGVSPKRFLQYLTASHAKSLLQHSDSVMDAALAAGLSGPGRLHDLMIAIDGVTPGEYRSVGPELRIRYGIHDSPFGPCLFACTERGLCGMHFLTGPGDRDPVEDLRSAWPDAELTEAPEDTRQFRDLAFPANDGAMKRAVNLLVRGTNLQIKIWEALLRIPPGSAVTYRTVAESVGHPRASRAVGNAVAANSIAYLIPCHRVIRATGVVGSYRWGADRKRAMLGWEAAQAVQGLEQSSRD
jgi:AraC family transcriptional regulator of adaptative response/methylated-DNA-[protein]-cysteine methyltransferase